MRLTRQQQIFDQNENLPADQDGTQRLWGIIDESALHRVVGSNEVMEGQREHLLKLAQLPNVTIQVIRDTEGVTCAYGRAFTILKPRNGSTLVYSEGIFDAHYIRIQDAVELYELVFDHLRSVALTDDKSLQLLKGWKYQ